MSLLLAGCDKQSTPAAQPSSLSGSASGSSSESDRAQAHANGLPAPDEQGVIDLKHKGEPIPSATFLGIDGKAMTLAVFKGRPILLNLWATWCGPCVAEMPKLDALAQAQADKLQVVTISQDLRGTALVAPWWAKHKPVLLQPYTDPQVHMLSAVNGGDYNRGSLPTSILYDKDGREVWRMLGAMDWTGPRAKELLAEGIAITR